MTKKSTPKAGRAFKKLASTGKYVSTGKVLIGVSYQPKLSYLNCDEELIQGVLLGTHRPPFTRAGIAYVLVLVLLVASLFTSCKS
jgi:hypothetical protein